MHVYQRRAPIRLFATDSGTLKQRSPFFCRISGSISSLMDDGHSIPPTVSSKLGELGKWVPYESSTTTTFGDVQALRPCVSCS
jgi:hypothetical protein